MDEDSAKVLRAYAGLKLRKSRKDGAYNVCKAWEDQYKEGMEEGQERMAKLIKILLEAKDYEIAERIADDTKLRDEYYERYGI